MTAEEARAMARRCLEAPRLYDHDELRQLAVLAAWQRLFSDKQVAALHRLNERRQVIAGEVSFDCEV
jgi:hypothetical protein